MDFVIQVLIPICFFVAVVSMVKVLWSANDVRYFETNGIEIRARRR